MRIEHELNGRRNGYTRATELQLKCLHNYFMPKAESKAALIVSIFTFRRATLLIFDHKFLWSLEPEFEATAMFWSRWTAARTLRVRADCS